MSLRFNWLFPGTGLVFLTSPQFGPGFLGSDFKFLLFLTIAFPYPPGHPIEQGFSLVSFIGIFINILFLFGNSAQILLN